MLNVTLPNGSQLPFDQPVSVADVAAHIGAGLAKAALAGVVDEVLVDTSHVISQDAELKIITSKDPEGLEILRHSCAHLLAQAVKQLFPSAQVTIGPVVEDGFYYDFAYERPFTPDDLQAIEAKMRDLAKADIAVKRLILPRAEAMAFFREQGEIYKTQIIEDIPEDETLTLYQQGDFTDLCRGPHVPRTGHLKAFKLTKLAGAYWRGDSSNEMLQRVYGTAWPDKKALQAYLHRLEEAQKRDHRKLGKELDLFHSQEEAPGMMFWHPNGWMLWQLIEQHIRSYLAKHGYQEVHTPVVVDRSLWEMSGHWEKFRADMFVTESESRDYAIKPMNCPCHVQIFNQGLKSYRDLPIRYAEFGHCHRNEASGTLHGLMRVRSMVQDDGHIFCNEEQIGSEAEKFIDELFDVYARFGFTDILLKVATRPENRVGSDASWDKAEQYLINAVKDKGLEWTLNPGEGAFYGPKIEFSLRDCLGRVWQCGTLQVDFSMPDRLHARYVAEDGSKQIPVMLHRALLGTMERFIGILIEHYAGRFPLWLAPIQAVALNITDKQADYVQATVESLRAKGFRVIADLRNEKIGFKIREHTLKKIPYMIIAGDKEVDTNTVSVRCRNGDDLGMMTQAALVERLLAELDNQ